MDDKSTPRRLRSWAVLAILGMCAGIGAVSCGGGGGSQSPNTGHVPSFDRPRGIYVLDSQAGTHRDANIRDYPFVDGYAWRSRWEDFEPSEGVYDFQGLDYIIGKLEPIGKKLSLQVTGEPSYIAAMPGVATYSYTDPSGQNVTKAVPWDPFLRARYEAFMTALGDHRVPNAAAGGALTPLRNHPVLERILAGVGVGQGWLREQGFRVAEFPGYTRAGFIDAIKTGLHSVTDNFPGTFVSIGFWTMTDTVASPALWEDMRSALLTEFGARVGFFMENLAASKDSTTGMVTGTPSTTFAAPLYLSKDSTHITFQALQAWNQPVSDPAKTANATPDDGLRYGYDTFGCTYFELYVEDLDDPNYRSSFEAWHSRIRL